MNKWISQLYCLLCYLPKNLGSKGKLYASSFLFLLGQWGSVEKSLLGTLGDAWTLGFSSLCSPPSQAGGSSEVLWVV